jgi:transposase
MDKDQYIQFLEKENAALKALVADLMKRVEALEQEVKRLRKGKNSDNSSMPPSSDLSRDRKKTSLRKKSGRKPGGQKGRKGTNLKMRAHPDQIIRHEPPSCGHCGFDLQSIQGTVIRKGQILDIPPIHLQVTEHQQVAKNCPCCGEESKGHLPGTLDYAPVQYGPRIKSLVSYLSVYQYLPVNRIEDMIRVLSGESISSGFIQNTIMGSASRLQPWYERILQRIKASRVVFSDETGCRIQGQSQWLWIWCTPSYNFVHASGSRGYQVVEETLGNGPFDFILVSDRYPAQLKTHVKHHQLCLAHLQRNCKALIDGFNSQWAMKLKKVLHDITCLTREKRIRTHLKKAIEKRLDRLLNTPLSKSHKDIKKLQRQLNKYRHFITTCLYHRQVPPDNNMAERGIRNVKVKQKVSTGFRSMKGAQAYAVIRSIVDSAIKQDIDPMLAIRQPELLFNLGE